MHCREILFTPHRSARTKEYGVRLRSYEASKLPIFALWPIFPIQNPEKSTLRWPASSPRVHRRMITIVPCGSRRSKGVPSSSGVFLRLLVEELWTPKLAQIFAYCKWLYPYRMLLHDASDLDRKCLKTRNSKDECTFGGLKNVPLYFSGFARDIWSLDPRNCSSLPTLHSCSSLYVS